MNLLVTFLLYTPLSYWLVFVLVLYRHDLSELLHPIRDDGSPRNWWMVLNYLGLFEKGKIPKKPGKGFLSLLIVLMASTMTSLSWTLRLFPPIWYYLVIAQGISAMVLTAATMQYLGAPPRKPFVDVLRSPRLGSRIRHLGKVPEENPTERDGLWRQQGGTGGDELTSNQEVQNGPRKRVRFFNASLRNGIVVSTPSYPEKQAFLGHIIRAIEMANPDFAWVQFLFVSSDYRSALIRLKNSLHRAKLSIEQPAIDMVSGQEHDRRELHRDFYRQSDARMKKVDEVISKPTVTLAIQGMWVSDKDASSAASLPFDHCSDEHDSLAVFQYRDPRMLLELLDRRTVTDISEYFERYTRSRMEPPSFLVTPESLQSYLQLPVGELAQSLHSLSSEQSKREYTEGKVDDEEAGSVQGSEINTKLVKLVKIPQTEKPLDDASIQPLAHLATSTVRTLELVYSAGNTEVLLSAETLEDMRQYAGLLRLVYGRMALEGTSRLPAYARDLSSIVRLE